MQWSSKQQQVCDRVSNGDSIFVTGSAGTGKSFVLRHLVQRLVNESPNTVYVTASTGLAGVSIGGTTLHSFAGIGLGRDSVRDLEKRIRRRRFVMDRWKTCQLLVIDEISMIDGRLFDKLETLARRIRGNDDPFGGIQLLLCGDFLQLPPVPDDDGVRLFCFEANTWSQCVQHTIVLTHVFRQAVDVDFQQLLQDVRVGVLSHASERKLQTCLRRRGRRRTGDDDDDDTMRLYSTRRCTAEENNARLQQLDKSTAVVYRARDTGQKQYLDSLQKNCIAPAELELRIGARVLLIRNLDPSNGLLNGSRGEVVDYCCQSLDADDPHGWPVVLFKQNLDMGRVRDVRLTIRPWDWTIERRGRILATRRQVPLILAWALTIHKSQGMTLEVAQISLRNCFEGGQAYVALSRLVSLRGLTLLDYSSTSIQANPACVQFYQQAVPTTTTTGCTRQRDTGGDDDDDDKRPSKRSKVEPLCL